MDVTCERCGTRYEFDEALVSARGTTVKCTNCGHQFKVYRSDGTNDLDGWTVRTSDGRELSFRAMRELQAAIAGGHVSQDDILVPRRGGSERQLSHIEELSSFFAGQMEAPTTRTRRATMESIPEIRTADNIPPQVAAGMSYPPRKGTLLGGTAAPAAAKARAEANGSAPPGLPPDRVTIPKAAHVPRDVDALLETAVKEGDEDSPPTTRRKSTLRPAAQVDDDELTPISPARPPVQAPPSEPDLATTAIYGSDSHPGEMRAPDDGASRVVPRPAASGYGTAEAVQALEAAVQDVLEDDIEQSAESSQSGARPVPPSAPRPRIRDAAPVEMPALEDDDTIGDLDAEHQALAEAKAPPSDSKSDRISVVPSSGGRHSLEPLTPTPSVARPSVLRRNSEVYSDPRFSGYGGGKRSGVARWAIGVVAVGIFAVGAATLLRRTTAVGNDASTSAAPAPDQKIETYLQEGRAHLDAGDVASAREAFVKASVVAEKDPRVLRALAQVAVVEADLDWLHARLVPEGTPHHAAVEQSLRRKIDKARVAADAAVAIQADDPVAAAALVDALRLAGEVDEARKHVAKLDRSSPDGARALAALDLTEEKPNFATVLDWLRTASRAERKLGRAHAMLVYALVRAGKVEDAKHELEALKRQNPHHTLTAVLQHFVDGTEPPAEAPEPEPEPEKPQPRAKAAPAPRPHDESGHAEPFASNEPDLENVLPPAPQPEPSPEPVPETPAPQPEPGPAPEPAPAPDPGIPPDVDVSDLPEFQ